MARDISNRLGRLNTRRKGLDRLGRLSLDAQLDVLTRSGAEEAWQKRALAKPYTRYALGAMQEVGPDYTRISLETAERVGKQLDSGLAAAGFSVDFRLQGSVPLNVHIRGVSDVDLLNLDTSFFTYARYGSLSQVGHYYPAAAGLSSIGVLSALRTKVESILKTKYPAADVDTSGGKAINISGGSLARPVDVVPSHWNDNIAYQASRQEHDRGVTILNKSVPETIDNLPFLHIKLITDRCMVSGGGLRKAIRLCKNVKSDASDDGTPIALSSFDIAATMYHADLGALIRGCLFELAILAETQRHLDWLTTNESEARKLLVPDGSRAIFDTPEKLVALRKLSIEMDDLLTEVAKEQDAALAASVPHHSRSRQALVDALVPFA